MSEYLTINQLYEILAAARGLRAGVVGDFTLDGYWIADMTRSQLSRETPLFPRPVVEERYSCGGAANVAWNLAALGLAEVRAFSVLGVDWRGELLRAALAQAGVQSSDCITDPGWVTPFFGKVILSAGTVQQEDARLDFINTGVLSVERQAGLLEHVQAALPHLDLVIIADYQPVGVITPQVLAELNEMAQRYPNVLWAVDSRERIGQFQGMVRKPNQIEAARWLLPERAPETVSMEELAEAALHPQVDCGCPLFITLGPQGCLALSNGESHLVPAVAAPPPVDPVGAGDTFLAALAAALAAGTNPLAAARLGHLAAGVTVKKLGITGAATPEEIVALAEHISD